MGQTIKPLAQKQMTPSTIFNNRFVVEVCEVIHVHYRNLRIVMSLTDWLSFARGNADALKRWEAQGKPEPSEGTHIELCRKDVARHPVDKGDLQVNLNRNLYAAHEGRVFAEGADFKEPLYVHLKLRDLRLELTLDEFNELHDALVEARANMGAAHAS